jgi:DNA primase
VIAEHPNELVRDQYLMLVSDRCRLEPDALRALASRVADRARTAPGETNGSRPRRTQTDGSEPRTTEGRSPATAPGRGGADISRPGLEALRLAVHRPERVSDRLEAVLFPDELQRAAFEALTGSHDLHDAVEAAEDHDPRVASLLRRLAVEEPATDADDVVVTLVRNASRRALAVAEAQARLSPNTVGEIAPVIARVRHDLDELDDTDRCLAAADRLLAWLVGRDDTNE